jgi:peptide/nickel transport system permease protein
MTVFILRRLAQTLLVLLITSVLVFGGLFMIGDPVEILVNPSADQIEKERATKALGLDKPLHEQYVRFLRGALTGNLGNSFVYARPALEVIFERMPATLELAFLAMLIAVTLGIPLGLYAGLRPHSPISKTIMAGSILGFSLPTFWVGLILILVFAVALGWLPSTGRGPTTEFFGLQLSILNWEGLKYALLPAINLALFKLSLIIRLTRAQVREQSLLDYVKFARAKGLRTCLARNGQAGHRFDLPARPPRGGRLPAGGRLHVHPDQPRGRRPVLGARPACAVVGGPGMSEAQGRPRRARTAVRSAEVSQ